MINIKDPADCCGCTACASICVQDAITMKPDKLGFLYPEIDKDKCVDCGLCERVCAFNDNYDSSLNFKEPIPYGARHKDMNEIETSRSGAAFIAISDYILEQGGVIYGAGYAEHFRVVHKRATTKEERNEFKGSKYVQSDMTGVFRQVKQDLRDGLIVLFSGTPCQTSGLNSYVGKRLREKLFLVDIVCHGVPSPYIWRDYLDYLEKKQGSSIVWVNFRDKQEYGWGGHHETFKFKNGEGKMSFTFLFYKHIMFRKSCEKCHFCNTKRPSDITIADFWGWEKTNKDFNADDKGCSLILINTEKGKKLFDNIKDRMNIIPADLEKCIQPNMKYPSPPSRNRNKFEQEYSKYGFEYVYYKYGEEGWRYKILKFFLDIRKKAGKIKRKILK
ncbi:Coenzyme F420 hydrogenase/dehydrogenase, beta subunit C-terminal domain [Leyella stercorea]|uniref:Coenzyme F420 hydrogenase/dehydrogenase, beta subunit C-terminal domain n=1 Tax=Leyella stercorea TaxID=363265 RepID=UPI003522067D